MRLVRETHRQYSSNHSGSFLQFSHCGLRSASSIKIRSADKIDRRRIASRSKNWKFTSSLFLAAEWSFGSYVLGAQSNVKYESIDDHFSRWPFVVTIVCPTLYLFLLLNIFRFCFWWSILIVFSGFRTRFLCSSFRSFIGCGSSTWAALLFLFSFWLSLGIHGLDGNSPSLT